MGQNIEILLLVQLGCDYFGTIVPGEICYQMFVFEEPQAAGELEFV